MNVVAFRFAIAASTEEEIINMFFDQHVDQGNDTRGASPEAMKSIAYFPAPASMCASDSVVTCSVCISEYVVEEQVAKLPCGHEFHSKCLGPWLESQDTCPVCRAKLIADASKGVINCV